MRSRGGSNLPTKKANSETKSDARRNNAMVLLYRLGGTDDLGARGPL
jgi:hypothetical protein